MGVSYQKVLDKLDALQDDVGEIKECARETNGRIRELERWRAFVAGGLAVLTILVIPLLLQAVSAWAK